MAMKQILTNDAARKRLDAMASVFTKTDQVLSGTRVVCGVATKGNNNEAPSWTDGRRITFNPDQIGDVTSIQDIIRISGLNYHELAHVLYTVREGREVQDIRRYGAWASYNMLEDQRIETILTAEYPSVVPFLVSTVMRFCLSHKKSWESNFPIIHGRYYLPKDVRDEFRNRFVRQDLVPEFERIIDAYRKLVLPRDMSTAYRLVMDFHQLLQKMRNNGADIPNDPFGHYDDAGKDARPETIEKGSQVPSVEQQEAIDKSDDMDEVWNGSDADAEAEDDAADDTDSTDGAGSGDADDDADDADGNGAGSGDGDSNADTDSDDDADSDSDDGLTDSDATGGTGAGGKGDKPDRTPLSDKVFEKVLDDYIDTYENLDEVQEEVLNKQRVISRGNTEPISHLGMSDYGTLPIRSDDGQAVRAFSKMLDRLRADSDPGWIDHRPSGKINVKRVMQGDPVYGDVWDEWNAGHNDASDIEAVLAIDTSGSMSGEIDMASRAMWIIKRALEKVDASVTVITFDSTTELAYRRDEKVDRGAIRRLEARGGTYARDAVIESARILSDTKRANRIFIVITDGQWDGDRTDDRSPYRADQIIKMLGEQGVTTALAYIGGGYYNKTTHGCGITRSIRHANDLAPFAEEIVKVAIKNRLKG